MRTITKTFKIFLFFIAVNISAQQSLQPLDDVIESAEIIKENAEKAKTSLRTLVINYFIYNNNNTFQYSSSINQYMEKVEEYSDEVYYFAQSAKNKNPNLDISEIQQMASQIEAKEDAVLNNSDLLIKAINQTNKEEARRLVRVIDTDLNVIIEMSNSVTNNAKDLKSAPKVYNVRIKLVDENSGATVDPETLPGYAAKNLKTGKYYYAGKRTQEEEYPMNVFKNLPAGKYRFDAYNGYFDGAGSNILTLSDSLVGADGYIVVTLKYWSE